MTDTRRELMKAMRSEQLPLEPSKKMIEAGAQRLVRCGEKKTKWPTSWSPLDVAGAREDAERCWRSMWIEGRLDIERAYLRAKRRGK